MAGVKRREGLLINVARSQAEMATITADLIEHDVQVFGRELREFRILLAGGATPRPTYAELAQRMEINWEIVELWVGDERCVPPDHPDSNYRMIREALIEPLLAAGRKPRRIVRWKTEYGAAAAAEQYERHLRAITYAGEPLPAFEVAVLGMGEDGHTAGIFPHTAAAVEQMQLAMLNDVPQLQTQRLTVTMPVLMESRFVYVLLQGEAKGRTLQRAMQADAAPVDLPIRTLLARHSLLTLQMDVAAGAVIGERPVSDSPR
ncbi:MAG: 6-phosphogluconolactonase [Caldilineaceae bacterium]